MSRGETQAEIQRVIIGTGANLAVVAPVEGYAVAGECRRHRPRRVGVFLQPNPPSTVREPGPTSSLMMIHDFLVAEVCCLGLTAITWRPSC